MLEPKFNDKHNTDAESVDFEDAADGMASSEQHHDSDAEEAEAIDPLSPLVQKFVTPKPPPAKFPQEEKPHPADLPESASRLSADSSDTTSARNSLAHSPVPTASSSISQPMTLGQELSAEQHVKDSLSSSASVATIVNQERSSSEAEPVSSAQVRESLSQFNLILDEETAKQSLPEQNEEVSPSVGATSMLEPDETISNPFASGSSSPTNQWAEEGSDEADPKRFSTTAGSTIDRSRQTSYAGDADSQTNPDTPSINSNHFSVVSLSSTAASVANGSGWGQGAGKRSTITVTPGQPESGESSQNYDFLLARLENQNAKLTSDPKAMRASVDGVDKLRENFEKLREQGTARHSRGESQNRALNGRPSLEKEVEAVAAAEEVPEATYEGPQGDELEDEAIDWEFWGNVMSNYQEVARTQPRELSRAIQAGIPAALRGMMWQLMSSSKDEEMEIIYAYYLKQLSSHEKAIRRDLNRTFPEQDYFQDGKGIGQENLFNVVKAYSLYDPEVGYCQGMQFVVGPLLLNMPDEEAFSTLVRLMKSYDLRGHFMPNMPSLQLRLFQFDRLLEEFLPLLHMHLVRQGVKSSMYASQWFMTLFSYRFPLDLVYRILDSVFAEGVEALFRFALAVMKKNEDALLQLNFEQSVSFLKQSLFDVYLKQTPPSPSPSETPTEIPGKPGKSYRTNEFVRDAFQIKITPFMLDSYASEFDEQVRAANAHRREVEALRLVNRNLAARVKSLEDQLNSVNAEHVDLVKSVVMANIAKEDMAEELVKYKMMYAEAVLQADQENSRGSIGMRNSARTSNQ